VSISSDFAVEVVLCAALSITLWAACAGVGLQLLPRTSTADELWSRRRPGVAACIGLGALMMIGGFALVLRIPWWLYTGPFVVVGLVLAVREFLGLERLRPVSRSSLVLVTLTAAAFGVVTVVESFVGLRFLLNRCDDLRAYLPMARRLLETYGLEEPWSTRRAQSLGGFDLLRMLPVAAFGDLGVGVADTAIASTFLAGLFVRNGLRSIGTRVLCILLVLMVPFAWVPRVNTTGVLLGTPLLVAVLAATAEMRRALRTGDTRRAFRWAAGAGLVIAALMSVRPNLGLLGALVVTLGVLLTTRSRVASRIQVVMAGGASTLVAVASWSFAMWRTVGTPLYPLFSGNMNTPALRGPPVGDLGRRADLAFDLVRSGPSVWVALAVLIVSLLARRLLADAAFIVIAALATIVVTTMFALSTPLLRPLLFARYAGPMSAGLAVFFMLELIRSVDLPTSGDGVPHHGWGGLSTVAAGVAMVAVSFSPIGPAWNDLPGGLQLIGRTAADDRGGSNHPPDNEAMRNSYREALASVVGKRTIAAVDRPYLIDYGRFDIPHVDAPGFMTPDGTFPFFTGPGPKVAVLRDAGFDVLLATDPDEDVCIGQAIIARRAQEQGPSRGIYRRFLDWGQDIQAIERLAPDAVQRFGSLLRIDLHAAARQLGA
jgi:hypothetical protein